MATKDSKHDSGVLRDLMGCCLLYWPWHLFFLLLSKNNDDSHSWQILNSICVDCLVVNVCKAENPEETRLRRFYAAVDWFCMKISTRLCCIYVFVTVFVYACLSLCNILLPAWAHSGKSHSHASWGQVRTLWGALFSRCGGPRGRGTPSALLGNSLGLIEAWLVSHVSTYSGRRRIPLPGLWELL